MFMMNVEIKRIIFNSNPNHTKMEDLRQPLSILLIS